MFNYFRSTLYVRIRPDRLSVRHVETGREYSDVPMIAMERKGGKTSVVGIGREAERKAGVVNVTVANSFDQPRTLVSDFLVAELTLKHFVKRALHRAGFTAQPIVVIHPQSPHDEDLTAVEIRAFAELGFAVGARRVLVWEGPELSTEELEERRFTRPGGQLLQSASRGFFAGLFKGVGTPAAHPGGSPKPWQRRVVYLFLLAVIGYFVVGATRGELVMPGWGRPPVLRGTAAWLACLSPLSLLVYWALLEDERILLSESARTTLGVGVLFLGIAALAIAGLL